MDVIDVWTGQRACALQLAMRLTNEGFAARLGTAARTVAKWSANPDMEPLGELQQALDTLLDQAPAAVKARFALLIAKTEQTEVTSAHGEDDAQAAALADAELRLASDRHVGAALAWLDRHAEWPAGTGRRKAANELASIDLRALHDRGHLRAGVSQQDLAQALANYYAPGDAGQGLYGASYDGRDVSTSILTRPAWLDLSCPLQAETDGLALTNTTVEADVSVSDQIATAAVGRLAESLAVGAKVVDAPLYRLLTTDIGPGRIGGTVGLTSFVQYAVTMDLLEGEIVDALAAGKPTAAGHLPLRDELMPNISSVLATGSRICAGGALALCAIARPRGRSRRAGSDYLLLVQERSGRVLNAARRLAVIPKCFHQPITDYDDDAQIGSTLRREMEEELFGREEVDGTTIPTRRVDPMHPSQLSEPMRWLSTNNFPEQWRTECTGFGLNLVSGNFEFASLIVIDDEEFWHQFGGHIEANWESDGLRQYSSLDRARLVELLNDPAWSNEGLFAVLQAFRRLATTGNERVNLPTVDWSLA